MSAQSIKQMVEYFVEALPGTLAVEDSIKYFADKEITPPTFTLAEIRETLNSLRRVYYRAYRALGSNPTAPVSLIDDFVEDALDLLQKRGEASSGQD